MPETNFQIQWPNGTQETCYSPSLVVKKYFEPGQDYPLTEFVSRSRESLRIASDRVQAKFGMPCSLALAQLQKIETAAEQFAKTADAKVKVLTFRDL
ncbi:MSMEG_0570 family nitrogen starvation response protein [Romeria aff. gracilis LEGE 07310]|uniref:MSMEG_0570 family nitrogen starvation response protein n=1 Tax=Vasconcelosia minhoensis LEGE 07310 TaxID=915328 RepID=A0A8J7DC55_9CYAN|nr:MSMEG_0570 family nitrogen starvation response protein [Romeria gracilis]MBE9077303.1 MSMEG_0570 family nitrogen starvation response protein [Romeria aff. gracilis LEGE 07310]